MSKKSIVRQKTPGIAGDLIASENLPKSAQWHDTTRDTAISPGNAVAGGLGSWTDVSDINSLEGSYLQSSTTDDTLTLAYTGTSMRTRFRVDKSSGIVEIMLDGVIVSAALDLFNDGPGFLITTFGTFLPFSDHTARIRVTGTKNASSSANTVKIDAILVDTGFGESPVISLAESTLSTFAVGAAAAKTIVQANTIEGGPGGVNSTVGTSVGANTDFASVTYNNTSAIPVKVVVLHLGSVTGTLKVLRDGGVILSVGVTAANVAFLTVLDNPPVGNHTYTLQQTALALHAGAMWLVDTAMTEADSKITSAGGNVIPNNSTSNADLSKAIVLAVAGDCYVLIGYYNESATAHTLTLVRDSTTLTTFSVAASKAFLTFTFLDLSVTAGSHTYILQDSATAAHTRAMEVVSNGGDPATGGVAPAVVKVSGESVVVSGQPVTISGQPVTVSGPVPVNLSGQMVGVSGTVVTSVSGNAVQISGQAVVISGQPVTVSGPLPVNLSGQMVAVSGTVAASVSGQAVTVSGNVVSVLVSGPLPVNLSGQMVAVSGTVITSVSGNVVTALVSGPLPVDVLSGQWYSGNIVQVSGQAVLVSGQPVTVSGPLPVNLSGQMVAVSGTVITSVSGNVLQISGQVVSTSGQTEIIGVDNSSGTVVLKVGYASGDQPLPVLVSGTVSASVSGNVLTALVSGPLPVNVSGQMVTVSGTVVTSVSGNVVTALVSGFSGQPVQISGQGVSTSVSGNVTVSVVSGPVPVNLSGQMVTVSGTVVTSVSGNVVVALVSGFSGQPVSTSVSGNIVQVSGQSVVITVLSGPALAELGFLSGNLPMPLAVESGQQVTIVGYGSGNLPLPVRQVGPLTYHLQQELGITVIGSWLGVLNQGGTRVARLRRIAFIPRLAFTASLTSGDISAYVRYIQGTLTSGNLGAGTTVTAFDSLAPSSTMSGGSPSGNFTQHVQTSGTYFFAYSILSGQGAPPVIQDWPETIAPVARSGVGWEVRFNDIVSGALPKLSIDMVWTEE